MNTLVLLILIAVFCFALERAVPGWKLPSVKSWPLRVIVLNLLQICVVIAGGRLWEKWFGDVSLFRLKIANPYLAGFVAYFIATFLFYWWHRWRHESDWLWRLFHQVHHSPQRLEVITSFYKHPLEMIVNSVIGASLVYGVLGLSVEAAAAYTLFTAVGEFFYHTNVRTPRWVGLIFQRPEMHRIHHQFGRHKNNYGDIVWWDMIFGTYENPKEFKGACGFETEREEALGDMIAFDDVHLTIVKHS